MDNTTTDHINLLPCGIVSFSDEGVITFINETLLKKLEYTSQELEGQNIEKILTLSSRIFYQTHFFPLLKLERNANEIFMTFLSKNKKPVPVLLNAVHYIQNNISVNTCACITVYERKKYEDEILHAKKLAEETLQKNEALQKVQQELESGKQELDKQITHLKYRNKELQQLNELIAHDLQEPVRKISLFMDIILHNKHDLTNEKIFSSFDIITKSANRMRSILQSLQEYMFISSQEIKKKPVDLQELANGQLKVAAEQHPDISFTTEVQPLPVINANAAQLEVLFYQLFKNCFTCASDERNLHIHISCASIQDNLYNSTEDKYKYVDFVKLVIEDNGIGFSPKYKNLIFKILKKLNQATQGLGFGLAICKRIVENHDGYIFASGGENKGAKFTIALPVN